MDISFWIGLALSIPLSILANIYTPKIQNYLDNRSQKISQKRYLKLLTQYEDTKKYVDKKELLRDEILETIILTTFIGTTISVVNGIVSYISVSIVYMINKGSFDFINIDNDFLIIFIAIIPQTISILGGLYIVNICNNIIKKYARLKNFKELEEKIKFFQEKIPQV